VITEPKPVRRVPILVGGGGERITMGLAAEHADIWNNLPDEQARLEEKVAILRQHCADLGRDPTEVTVSQTCLVTIAEDEAAARPMVERAAQIFRATMGDAEGRLALSGSPAQVAERVQAHLDAGCTMFHIQFFGRDPRIPAALFARTVMPLFR
jgi:alkanesulfonate monooxygenase SsuD/methylene tetrahydromethanopterin reductase-like flavin-dependent oxidoreductase (luciferase family)